MKLAALGVPFDLDVYRQNSGLTPEALVAAGLLERLGALGADVSFQQLDVDLPEGSQVERIGALLGPLGAAVAEARRAGRFPLILGGDCLTAIGTLAGLGSPHTTAVAWVDAHGDFNTPESTLSNYLGGMPLAAAVGRCLPELRAAAGLQPVHERNVALIGVRDLDEPEKQLLQESEITVLSAMDLIQRKGDLGGALELLRGAAQVYLHFDIDVIANADAPAVDYPAAGGLSPAIAQSIARDIAGLPNIAAIAFTAINPARDVDGRTIDTALDIIQATVQEVLKHQG